MSGNLFGSALTRRPTSPSMRVASCSMAFCASSSRRLRSTRFHVHKPAAVMTPKSTAAIVNRNRWNRLARCIMARWGSVQRRGWVSVRMPSHSQRVGRWRFSGLAFHRPERSASFSSARPRRVSFCLRVSHSRNE